MTAEFISKQPKVKEILARCYGWEFVSGSLSMEARKRKGHGRYSGRYPDAYPKYAREDLYYAQEMGAYLLDSKILPHYTEEVHARVLKACEAEIEQQEKAAKAWQEMQARWAEEARTKAQDEQRRAEEEHKRNSEENGKTWDERHKRAEEEKANRDRQHHRESRQPPRNKLEEARSILGVSATATKKDIRAAYKKLVFMCHPDKDKSTGAAERFKKIQEAYEYLSH